MSEPSAEGRRRLSMNQATVPRWGVGELMEACADAGYGGVGLWRDRVAESGARPAGKLAAKLGLEVTSLCRGGWFLVGDRSERTADNRRAVEEAAELGAKALVLVCGPAPDRDLVTARAVIAEAIAELAAYAGTCGVAVGIEPMHPLYCGDRSVVVTLDQALAITAASEPAVGVILDSYHLWWDPELERSVARAAGSILGVQLADWLAPPPDPLNGRGMLGEGTIDLDRFCGVVQDAGYPGLVEIEIFNPEIWAREPAEVLELSAGRALAALCR